MSFIVLDIVFAVRNVISEWGLFMDGKNQSYSIRSPKKHKPTKHAFWCTKILHRHVWNKGCLDYSGLPNVLPKDIKAEDFPKWTEKWKTLGNLMYEEVQIFDDHGWLKIWDLVDPKAVGELCICSIYSFQSNQQHASMCSLQGKVARSVGNGEFEVVLFVLLIVWSAFTQLNLSKWFNFFPSFKIE